MRSALRPWTLGLALLALVGVSVTGLPNPGTPVGLSPAEAVPTALPSPLPVGWILYDSNRCALPATTCVQAENWEIYAQDPSGNTYQLTDDPNYDSWWPKLSPDRTMIMFMRNDAGTKESDWNKSSLWLLPVDGVSFALKKLIGSGAGLASPSALGWDFLAHPEWAPTQDRIAIIGRTPGSGPQIYVVPFDNVTKTATTASTFRITHGATTASVRPGLVIDPSWNPNGGSVLFSGCVLNVGRTACSGTPGLEIFLASAVPPPVSPSPPIVPTEYLYSTPSANLKFDAYFSPNGTQVAYLHENNCSRWSIYHGTANGASPMTNISAIVDDGATNSKPAWNTGSSAVYFHKYNGIEQTIWSTTSTGTGLTQLSIAGSQAERCSAGAPSLASGAAGTPTGVNPLPAGDAVYTSNRCRIVPSTSCVAAGQWDLFVRPSGSSTPVPLLPASGYESFDPVLSPDRSQVLFLRAPIGQRGDSTSYTLWVTNATPTSPATAPVQLTVPGGFVRINNPSWSPNTDAIVFDASTLTQELKGPGRDMNNQIYWVAYNKATKSITSGSPYQATWGASGTGDRPGNNIQPAWNPDGGSIVFAGCQVNGGRTACDATYSKADVMLISSTTHTVELPQTITTVASGGAVWRNPAPSPDGTYYAATKQTTCSSTQIVRITRSTLAQTTLYNPTTTLVDNAAWNSGSTRVYFDRLPQNIGPNLWTTTVGAPPATSPTPTQVLMSGSVPIPCGAEFPNVSNF